MANGSKNLRKFQSIEEAREAGRKGGIRSGEVRRNKKRFKELAILFGSLPPTKQQSVTLTQLGVKKNEQNMNAVIMARLIQKAAQGDIYAIKLFSDLNSEAFELKTADELPMDALTESLYEEAEKMNKDDKS